MNKYIQMHLNIAMIALITFVATSLLFADGPTTFPTSFELTIAPDQCVTRELEVILQGGPVISKGDIVFDFDLSGSMGDDIDAMKAAADDIMSQISAMGIDAAFGVVSFVDYPHYYNYCGYADDYGDAADGDYAWKVDHEITSDMASIASTINGLNIYYGVDSPQDYSRALYETQFLSWRPNSKRIVVMMGDAPGHDCDFYSPTSYGVDPGRDEIAGTSDDLDYETVVSEIASSSIQVVAINSGTTSDAAKNFQYMAAETNGRYFEASEVSEIPQAIVDLIGEVFSSITWLTLDSDPAEFNDYVSWEPHGYADLKGDTTVTFKVDFCVPAGTPNNDYAFNLNVIGDGSTIATVPVLAHVSGIKPPIADFNSDRNVGFPPMNIRFEDLSENTPTFWDWNVAVGAFGGRGIHFGDQHPATQYWITGKHDVSLAVANDAGADTLTRWVCNRAFVNIYGPCGYTSLELEDSSPAFPKEPWENAIDGDIWGWDGTATVEPDNPWAIFKFKDGRTKNLTKVRLLTNTGVGYKERWIHDFHVDVSTDGINWTTALSGHHEGNFKIGPDMWDPDGGWWQEFMFDQPVMASYVKLVVDNPPPNWAQIGEFEVYEDLQLPDPELCTIDATGPVMANGVDASTVTLTLKDSNGDPVTGYDENDILFACMDVNPNTYQFGPIIETEPGVYNSMLTSTTDGLKKIVAAAHGAVVGYHKDSGWTTEISFFKNVYEYGLKIVESSESFSKESWANIIDGDYEGWDGTATVKGDPPFAILAFQNDGIYKVSKFGIQTDNGTDDDSPKVVNRQARKIRIDVSTTGLEEADFTTVLEGRIKSGDLQYFRLPSAVDAKYIKLVVLEPNWGADTWRQIVEFEVHLDVKGDLPKELADEAKQADTFALEQNYPNPFNPTTAINYQLPEDAHVTLMIYNTLGQQVATLVDGFVEAGNHRVSWNAIDMPAGVYIYRIQAGKFSKATRMILLK